MKGYRPERCALRNAKARCVNEKHPQYKDYGGRGITVHESFFHPETGFATFLEEVGPRPNSDFSLDRIDNDKGYEPGNVRWAARLEQAASRRKSKPRQDYGWGFGITVSKRGRPQRSPYLVFDGRKRTLVEWARELNIKSATIRQRLGRGWPMERVLAPVLFSPWNKPRANKPGGEQHD